MISIEQLLGIAKVRRDRGQLLEEQQLLSQILTQNPDSGPVHHLLGKNLLSMKQYGAAGEHLRTAARLAVDEPGVLTDLGYAYLNTEQPEDALTCFRRAETLVPYAPAPKIGLARLYCNLQRYDDAARNALNALQVDPDSAEAHLVLGQASRELGKWQEAMSAFVRSLECDPDNWQALYEQGLIFISIGHWEEAVSKLVFANVLSPLNPRVCSALCGCLIELGRFEESKVLIEQLESMVPGDSRTKRYAAIVAYRTGDPYGAVAAFAQALSADATNKEIVTGLMSALVQAGKATNAVTMCDNFLQNHPAATALLPLRGRTALTLGHYRDGLKDLAFGATEIESDKPLWKGEPLRGKTLLVSTNVELDEFALFLRFLPFAKSRGARIVIEVTEPFKSLVSRLPDVDDVWDITEPVPHFDCYTTIERLPSLLQLSSADLFGKTHLPVDEELKAVLGERMARIPSPRVGLMWRKETHCTRDVYHSISLDELAPLFNVDQCSFVCFQTKLGLEEVDSFIHKDKLNFVGLENDCFDLRLAGLAHLDLFISVDTISAEIAGTAGLSVWTLLSSEPAWYFPIDEKVSPWLPSMRQFRRKPKGQWSDAVAELCTALKSHFD